MKSLIGWAVRNAPAMNTLLVGTLIVGTLSALAMRREVFPEFELEIVLVTVPYPGASPSEVEEGICQKVEEGVQGVAGVKKIYSVAKEGVGSVILELEGGSNPQKVLNEVRSEVDRIPSFPELAEDPEVKQITLRSTAIQVGLVGPDEDTPQAHIALRELAEEIRDEMLRLPSVSQVSLLGGKPYEISVEISESTLRKYGLTLRQVAQRLREQNIEMPTGKIKTQAQEVLLRGKNKGTTGQEIAKLPVITQPDGTVLTVGDLGTVRDEFTDTAAISRINGRPGIALVVSKTQTEDLIRITDEVKAYLSEKKLPAGYELITWDDVSVHVQDRLNMLLKNGAQGLIIVFVVLALFLELRLAFWVALAVPVSMLGACAIMLPADQTVNMLSMFAFVMALGILVDDGIVVGENVYAHRQRGKDLVRAAIDGTYEVMPSVTASVLTTVIAFVPLLFVPGVMGKFIAVMPFGIIAMLLISLVEVFFVLPCHLTHRGDEETSLPPEKRRLRRQLLWIWRVISLLLLIGGMMMLSGRLPVAALSPIAELPFATRAMIFLGLFVVAVLGTAGLAWRWVKAGADRLNAGAGRALDWTLRNVYRPLLRAALHHPLVTVATAIALLLTSLGFVQSGIVPFVAFPKLDGNTIQATIYFPDGTPVHVTDKATQLIEQAAYDVHEESAARGMPLLLATHRLVGELTADALRVGNELPAGSHSGKVQVELVEPDERNITSEDIIKRWRERAMELGNGFPGAESLSFGSMAMGPGGKSIEFRLTGSPRQMEQLEKAAELCKQQLAQYPGVYDIQDDSQPGKWEYQIKVKENAKALGITMVDVAGAIRAAYYGEEVMRLQRGRHEVKLMVRYPEEDRRSLSGFENIRLRTGELARPITEVAEIQVVRGYSQITRLDQRRAVAITADVDEGIGNSDQIVSDLKRNFLPQLLSGPEFQGIGVRWEGMQEQTQESIDGLLRGLVVALIAMFALLTLEFRSYTQPLIIMAVIPFGMVGAVFGHFVMGLPLTLFSLFGMVALTGVVVNDSIVLIDFINHRARAGVPILDALIDAGSARFRPVLLTSVTTVGGLAPILFETSFQAQVLIPMVASLSFGLIATTGLVLLLAPVFYLLYAKVVPIEVDEADVARAVESGLIEEQGQLASEGNGQASATSTAGTEGEEASEETAAYANAAEVRCAR